MTPKQTLVQRLREKTTNLAVLLDDIMDAVEVYQQKGYGTGASDPIETDDLPEGAEYTPLDIEGLITMALQMENLNHNLPAVSGYYSAIIAKTRTDFAP